MTDIIKHDGILIGTGYFAEINSYGSEVGTGPSGTLCMIERMHRTKRGENFVAARSLQRMKSWPGVDGFIQSEYGIEYEIHDFVKMFNVLRTTAIVNGYIVNKEEFNNVPSTLIGLILDRRNREFSALVEFDFCINNGGCADGLGKLGQCLCIPVKYLDFYLCRNKLNFDDILTMSEKDSLRTIDRNVENENKINGMKLKKMAATATATNLFANEEPETVEHFIEDIPSLESFRVRGSR